MNIELDEVVVQHVSDEALELAAGGAQGGALCTCGHYAALVLVPATPVTYNLGVCYEY